MTTRPTLLKRQYLINKNFQLTLLGYFLFLSVICLTITYLGGQYFISTYFADLKASGVQESSALFELFYKHRIELLKAFVTASVLQFVIIIIFGIIITNKVAGPFYRFHRYLEEQTEKTPVTPLNFREDDFFQEIPESFNHFLKKKGLLENEEISSTED